MKVILLDNIEYLGKKGDIVNVAPGYGRNYLIPKNFALEVTPTNLKLIEMQQRALKKGLEKEIESHRALINQLNQVRLTFPRKAGEKDAIFGSVSTADIREALGKLNFDIEKKKILLDEPIKKLGNYTVAIKVFHDEKAEVNIEVVKQAAVEKKEKGEEKEKTPVSETESEAAAVLEDKGTDEEGLIEKIEEKKETEEIVVSPKEAEAPAEEKIQEGE